MSEKTKETSAVKVKKPIYKKWWFWLIIGVVILAIIVSMVSGTSDNKDNSNNTNNGVETRTYSVGEVFDYDCLEIEVNKYVVSEVSDIYYGQGQCTKDERFIVVVATITNTSNSTVNLKKYGQNVYSTGLYYINGEERISYSTRSSFYNSHFIDYYDEIIPLGTIEVYFSFKVPETISNGKFIFKFSENKKATKNIVEVKLN